MFSLHETTKIHLCRAAFVTLCLLPTGAVLAWSVAVRLPSYTRAHERAIAAQLGLHAQLTKASSPRPDTMLYEGLELSDPNTRQLLARLPFVEVRAEGGELNVRLPFPAIVNGTRLDAFWKMARDQVRQSPAWSVLRLEARNMTLHLSDGDQSFTDLDGLLENTADQTQLRLNFRRAGAAAGPAEGAELTIAWHHDPAGSTSTIHFNSGASPLPCSTVAAIWPAVQQMGKASAFAGRISVSARQAGWKAQFAGRLSGVDLDLAVGGRFLHKLTGPAEAQFEHLSIEDGRIESAAGKLTAGPGVIGRSLVESAQTHLHVQPTNEALKGKGRLLPYTQLCLSFELTAAGLALQGTIPRADCAMLSSDRGVLVREPALPRQPVVNLVRTLVPQTEVQVPATRETDALTRVLPIPSIFTPAAGQQPLPQAKAIGVRPGPVLK
jgi:hypothetical protein